MMNDPLDCCSCQFWHLLSNHQYHGSMHPDLQSQGQKQDKRIVHIEDSAEERVDGEEDTSALWGLILVVANIALATVVHCDRALIHMPGHC